MDRELLIEIGCEEIPASWLPPATAQLAQYLEAQLKAARLVPAAPIETYSTPRRLTARIAKLGERQTDFEELVTGPPVSATFAADSDATPAATGFARKHGVAVSALERLETPKGVYLAHRVHERGRATSDVLGSVMGGLLRDLTFPKQMRWDAHLEDGRGDLLFARPIRWLVLLYGGRVVPFVIRRTDSASGPNVQDIRSGASTHGHRFLTTSGRAGRAIKVKTFEEYQSRLLENFVILDRAGRESKIRRELETQARRLGGRVGSSGQAQSSLLQEVPDLVEYPSVVAGHFPVEFLQLPEEVLTATMIHHQHYFPVVDDEGALKPAFLAVTNVEAERPDVIGRNAERVLTARLRDARFFWDEDRTTALESRVERLSTIRFHSKLGSYREKADRMAGLAAWIAADVLGQPGLEVQARDAARLAKCDLTTGMVRELTELQGVMGGIYAREEGLPEAVWKAVYFHYLPAAVDADAAPSRSELGAAAATWAAVSLADKLDSVVGMFTAGERPTGSRDPLGLRRQAQGVVKVLADLPELTGLDKRLQLGPLLARAAEPYGGYGESAGPLFSFVHDRLAYLLEARGFDVRSVRAVTHRGVELTSPLEARRKLEALEQMKGSKALNGVAALFKRAKNITKDIAAAGPGPRALTPQLTEPAELALASALIDRSAGIREGIENGQYAEAFSAIALLQPEVTAFFDDVLVMAEDPAVRAARLGLIAALRDLILEVADISEIVAEW